MTAVHEARTRERRCELLAAADAAALVALAERCVEDGAKVTVLAGPEVGVVALQVREPIVRERFHLGEVLVAQVEVDVDGSGGWAMRMGGDRVAALAAAILDAVAAAPGPHPLAAQVEQLCDATEAALRAADEREWAQVAPTEVQFEELD